MLQLDTENADRNLTSTVTVLTHTPDASNPRLAIGYIKLGDGTKNLNGSGGNFELTVTVGGQTVQAASQVIVFTTAVRSAVFSAPFPVPANEEVQLKIKSPNGADTDVDVTAYLYDAQIYDIPGSVGSLSAQAMLDVAAAMDASGYTAMRASNLDNLDEPNSNTAHPGDLMLLGTGAITADAHDQTTSFPLSMLDEGGSAVARVNQGSPSLTTINNKTTNLPGSPASQTKLDTLHDTRIPGVIQPQTGDAYARLGAPAGASLSADVAAVKTDTAATLADTGTDGVIVASGSLSAIADAVLDEIVSGHAAAGSLGALMSAASTVTTAQVLAQVNAALDTAIAELSAGAPTATPTIRTALMLLYMAFRNDLQQTATERRIKNDAGTTIAKGTVSDSAGVLSTGELGAP